MTILKIFLKLPLLKFIMNFVVPLNLLWILKWQHFFLL